MHITLEQRGGFAGLTMRRNLDTASLPTEQATQVQELVTQADFFTCTEAPPTRRPGADMQTYVMTVVDGERKRTLHWADGALPPTVRPLLAYMQKVQPEVR